MSDNWRTLVFDLYMHTLIRKDIPSGRDAEFSL